MRSRRIARFVAGSATSAVLLGFLPLPYRAVQADAGGWTSNGPADSVGEIAVAPSDNRIVYAIGQQGLWKSGDGGNSWSLAGSTKIEPGGPLAVDPRDAATIYSDGRPAQRGIIKSTDGGASWSVLRPTSQRIREGHSPG